MSSATPIQTAVIGLGKMGIMHAAMISSIPQMALTALVDLNPATGAQAQSIGAQAPLYTSLPELFEKTAHLDAVIISTPQFTHRETGIACLERGLHVFLEKPLAHNLTDAQKLAGAAKQHPDQVTAIGFMKGHYPLWIEAARRLQAGHIGQPRRYRAAVYFSQVLSPKKGWTFTKELSGGGILINSGVHLLHFLNMLFGQAARVTALSTPLHSDVEDTLAALIEYPSGLFGSYDASWSLPGHQTESTCVLIEGSEGIMEITDDWLRVYHINGKEGVPKGWTKTHRGEFDHAKFNLSPDYGGEGYYNQLEDFAQAIQGKRPARYDWQTGLAIQQLTDAIYRSAESKQAVSVEN